MNNYLSSQNITKKVINPETGRKIMIGGKTYNKLIDKYMKKIKSNKKYGMNKCKCCNKKIKYGMMPGPAKTCENCGEFLKTYMEALEVGEFSNNFPTYMRSSDNLSGMSYYCTEQCVNEAEYIKFMKKVCKKGYKDGLDNKKAGIELKKFRKSLEDNDYIFIPDNIWDKYIMNNRDKVYRNYMRCYKRGNQTI